MTDGEEQADFQRGLRAGLLLGVLLGGPAGVALKVAGYPRDLLYLWWSALAAVTGLVVLSAALLAVRRPRLAGGLVVGAVPATGVAPLLVLLDILAHSA